MRRLPLFLAMVLLFPLSPLAGENPNPPGLAPRDHNIILVFVDALRADHIGAYRYRRNTTPNLDILAAEGIVFENHFTPYTLTLGSFMSMITGLYPDSHGVRDIAKDVLSEEVRTLAEILQEQGYETTWYGPQDDPHLASEVGFGRGFAHWGIFPDEMEEGRILIDKFLTKSTGKKFFLNFHTYKVHDPYFPNIIYKEYFVNNPPISPLPESISSLEESTMKTFRSAISKRGDNYIKRLFGTEILTAIAKKGILDNDYPEDVAELHRYLSGIDRLYKWDDIVDKEYKKFINCGDKEIVDYVTSLYDAEILEFDTEIIGPLIGKLKETGLYDKTILIVAADHGDEFCEHGLMGHGLTPYDEVIHVPLIVRVPWQKGGIRISALTMTIDLVPTLLDILGVDSPKYVQGASLKRTLYGQGGDPARSVIMANYPPGILMYRDVTWKFVLKENGDRQLFNLKSDPAERNNVVNGHPELADSFGTKVGQWNTSLPSYRIDRPFLPKIDEATKEKIKKTGYW